MPRRPGRSSNFAVAAVRFGMISFFPHFLPQEEFDTSGSAWTGGHGSPESSASAWPSVDALGCVGKNPWWQGLYRTMRFCLLISILSYPSSNYPPTYSPTFWAIRHYYSNHGLVRSNIADAQTRKSAELMWQGRGKLRLCFAPPRFLKLAATKMRGLQLKACHVMPISNTIAGSASKNFTSRS